MEGIDSFKKDCLFICKKNLCVNGRKLILIKMGGSFHLYLL